MMYSVISVDGEICFTCSSRNLCLAYFDNFTQVPTPDYCFKIVETNELPTFRDLETQAELLDYLREAYENDYMDKDIILSYLA